MKQRLGIIGYPARYSLSPYFQQAAIDHYHLDIDYEIWETKLEDLASVIRQLKSPLFLGANITAPYKENVMNLLDKTDGLSNTVGAVNTIVKQGTKLIGLNTDVAGFTQSLLNHSGFITVGKNALVLGAGGAAKAIVYALISGKVSYIAVANRSLKRAVSLVDYFSKYCDRNKYNTILQSCSMQDDELNKIALCSDIVVNCTTIGMKNTVDELNSPLNREMIDPHTLIYDLVYNPSETIFMKMAKQIGAPTLNGLHMLIYQGAESFHYWTGKKPPISVMFDAAKKAFKDFEIWGK